MDKRPALPNWVYFIFIILALGCSSNKDPKVFEKHLADYPDIQKKYIYQSVLRLANTKHDPDFDKLIKDVRKVTIYLPPDQDSAYQVKGLRSSMRSGGYEELMDFRTANSERVSLWLNESLPDPHYVGLIDAADAHYIVDIDGQINLDYISALNVADEGSLRDLFK